MSPGSAERVQWAAALLATSMAFLALVGWGPDPGGPRHATPAPSPIAQAVNTKPGALVGCRPRGASYRRSATPHRRAIAIGFDDGPSRYTAQVLRILDANHATATFFEVGRNLSGYGAVMRQILREGSTIGNHSLTHANLAAGGRFARFELRKTSQAIHHLTGFEPCLFRAPYGAVSARLVREARARDMLTIQWNVDPSDYTPGKPAYAIAGAVSTAARNGSIVVMHDGGGDRTRTVRALPLVLHRLRREGYAVMSVDRLLRLKREYRRSA